MSGSNQKNLLLNIQGLRGFAAILVVIYHIYKYEGRITSDGLLSSFWMVGRSGVDLFFVISGYIMVMISESNAPGLLTAKDFALRRAFRIYPLYWFFTLIVLPIYWFQPQLFTRPNGASDINLWKSFLLIPDTNIAPLVGQGWTLIHEMYFYLVFSVIILFPAQFRDSLIFLWATVIGCTVWVFDPPSSPVCDLVLHPLTFEFLFGCCIALLHRRSVFQFGFPILVVGIMSLCLAQTYHHGIQRVFWQGIPSALIVWGVASLELGSDVKAPRWLIRVGDASYSLYLCHILVLSVILKLWKVFGLSSHLHSGLMCLLMMAASIVTGFLVSRFVEKPLIRASKLILQRLSS